MAENLKAKPFAPVGPFAPPTPSEVDEREEGIPMAVANDERTIHDAFMPTTASKDPYAPDALDDQPPAEEILPHENGGNREAERPPGYTRVDEQGFRELKTEPVRDPKES